jgi:FkbM family methyltransferase
MHRSLRTIADRTGIGDPLRRLRDRGVELRNKEVRRNRIDDEHLALVLAFALRRDSNCLDVGAHDGLFLRDLKRVAPLGRHLAYEPIPHLYEALVRRFPDIEIRRKAASDADGETTFVYVPDLPGYSGLRERRYPREVERQELRVEVERIDDHLPEGWLPAFMKIDVEGAEALVFAGAMDTIRKAQPIIAFEHGKGASTYYGTGPSDIYQLLAADAGLLIFDMDGRGPYSLSQFEDEYHFGSRWNFLARP